MEELSPPISEQEVPKKSNTNMASEFVASCRGMYDQLRSYWAASVDVTQNPHDGNAHQRMDLSRRAFLRLTFVAGVTALATGLNPDNAFAYPIDDEPHERKENTRTIEIHRLEEKFDLPTVLVQSIYDATEKYKHNHDGKGLDADFIAAVARWEHRGTGKTDYEQALKDTFPPSDSGDYGPFQINERWFNEKGSLKITKEEANDPKASAEWTTVVLNFLHTKNWKNEIVPARTEKERLINMYQRYNGTKKNDGTPEYGDEVYRVAIEGLKVPEQ